MKPGGTRLLPSGHNAAIAGSMWPKTHSTPRTLSGSPNPQLLSDATSTSLALHPKLQLEGKDEGLWG